MSECQNVEVADERVARPYLRRLWRLSALVSAGLLTLVTTLALATGTAMAAGTGYYTPPPRTVVPGGFTAVVTSQIIGPAGGTKNISLGNGVQLEIDIPAGTFTQNVVFTIFTPNLISIGNGGVNNYHAVAGLRFIVTEGSSLYSGNFNHSIIFSLISTNITTSSKVVIWNGSSFVIYNNATVSNGKAIISVDSDPDFAVLSPNVVSPVIPSSTTVTTGEPFFGEELLAGLLLLLGAGSLLLVARKRRRATHLA